MNKEEILYNEIYERTKDFGRTHFIKEIMRLQRELEQLKEIEKEHQKINGDLREEIKDLEFIIGLRTKRNLISKFDKEYDEEDKNKNPNRDYAAIIPDAEEVYRRYYELKDRIDKAIEYINKKAIKKEIQETRNIVNIIYSLKLNNYEFIELEDILKGGKE